MKDFVCLYFKAWPGQLLKAPLESHKQILFSVKIANILRLFRSQQSRAFYYYNYFWAIFLALLI